ncbi:uncharacterized protein F4807DRAFT_465795 [Annulohypoxylon truncatum]|uniref:uncharacterized protein n=1 Tax=Annulohypoxylon truncatum TaxID=327061 RepID=UPI002008B363|nr:uncharacterized protein F4807DRAFT_465795 [Annulohypoxylon truncatum]KAI1204350.1 hypothetical protein F4807DRAFT_465795 [Annulohypoxylon truncatum]
MATVENRGPELMRVCIALLTTTVIAISLRCYTRLGIVKAFGADDWTMMAATVSFILFCTCAITGIHYGTGRHFADLETPDIEKAMMYWWLCYIWYCLTMIASKISIGLFLLRIAVQRIHHYIIYVNLLLTVLTGLVFFFVTLLQCNPIPYFWLRFGGITQGSCIDVNIIAALTYLYSALNVICDFTFATLPIVLIWGLQMDKRTKIALIPILSMGCVASSAVVVRLAYIKDFKDPDFLWATVYIAVWSTTEQGLAITAGSLATLRPLYRIAAQGLGMWSSTAGIAHSDNVPKTFGSSGVGRFGGRYGKGNKGSRGYSGGFDLTTFAQDEEAQNSRHEDQLKMNNTIICTTDITVKRSSIWGSSKEDRSRHNESQEELHLKSSKDTLNDSKTVPKSFLANGRTSRNSDGS